MSSRALYLEAAKDLRPNEGQWAAYESVGNCVVLAGPGSGKTKTLTVKLARLLAEDIEEPRGIACITYNNECARELEARLAQLGIEADGRVFIGTVHSFSLTQIVIPYANVAGMGLPEDFRVATRAERTRALENAFDEVIDRPGKPSDFEFPMGNYRRSILDRDSEEWLTSDPEMAALVEAYERELRQMGCIDFDDMPLLAVRALRQHEWLQRAILAKYPVLAVDEYQDLGRALHRMVMGLCFSVGMRLFAVGDVDQSIYGFNGAYPELLERLSRRDDVETVRLRLNYRCGTRIVTASGYALGEDRGYVAADGAEQGTIYFHEGIGYYENQARELFEEILPDILERMPELELGDFAILYAGYWLGDILAEAAQAHGLATIRSDRNSLYPRASRLMRWLELCAVWCCGGWKSGEPRFRQIVSEGRRLFGEVLTDQEKQLAFERTLMSTLWDLRDGTMLLHDWLIQIDEAVLSPVVSDCRAIQDEAETLEGFIERCATGDCAEMSLGQFSGQGSGRDCLNLSTLHSAKGREFAVVIMFGIDEGSIPRRKASAGQIIESRRLFYVGFTRAKSELHLMYSRGKGSRFVSEVLQRLEEEEA